MKPGENTGNRGGIFLEVDPRGGRQSNFSTVPDNRQLRPTTKPGHCLDAGHGQLRWYR